MNVVAVEGDPVLGGAGRMTTNLGVRHVEDEPAIAYIGEGETEFVPDECADLLGRGTVKHRVYSLYHRHHSSLSIRRNSRVMPFLGLLFILGEVREDPLLKRNVLSKLHAVRCLDMPKRV